MDTRRDLGDPTARGDVSLPVRASCGRLAPMSSSLDLRWVESRHRATAIQRAFLASERCRYRSRSARAGRSSGCDWWRRSAQRAAAVTIAAVSLAGCGGTSASKGAGGGVTASLLRCTHAVGALRRLRHVSPQFLTLRAQPFGIAAAKGFSFVTLGGFAASPAAVGVYSDSGRVPRLLHRIPLPLGRPAGEALTPDGRHLLVATGAGAVVVDAARAEAGEPHAVLGVLSVPQALLSDPRTPSAIELSTSRDGRFAFVSLEFEDMIAVFNVQLALRSDFHHSGFVGLLRLGHGVTGSAVSPDGRWLYVTSEVGVGPLRADRAGTLSVIDVRRAEVQPAHALVATVGAGCRPVRVAVSPDGRHVWVTARGSDALLGFSAAELHRDSKKALVAAVRVGESPVGVVLIDHGHEAIVSDSNRFSVSGAEADVSVVDTEKALSDKASLRGRVRSGVFPREMVVEPDTATVLVTNFDSAQLEVIDFSHT